MRKITASHLFCRFKSVIKPTSDGLLATVVIIAFCMIFYNMNRYSPVQSEVAHLASGLTHWHTGTFELYNVNPPFVRMVSSFPLLFQNQSPDLDIPYSQIQRPEFYVGAKYIEKNKQYVLKQLKCARFTCLIFVGIALYACYSISKRWGRKSSLIALCALGLNPYFIGHSSTIMPDAHAASAALLAVFFFNKWLITKKNSDLLWAGIVLGIAELTKYTLLVLYPSYIIVWAFFQFPQSHGKFDLRLLFEKRRIFRSLKSFLQLLLLFAVSLFVINAGYSFEGTGKSLSDFSFKSKLFTGRHQDNRFKFSDNELVRIAGNIPVLLPENYIQGIDVQRCDFENGLHSYLRGKWALHGWWYYYLYSFAVKIPLGTLCLFFLALFCTFFLKGYNDSLKREMLILTPGIAILVFVSSQTGFSVHSRYAIPSLPFFFVWISKVGKAFARGCEANSHKSSRVVRFFTVLFLAWSIGSSLLAYPHSISYFNELAAIIPTPDKRIEPNFTSRKINSGAFLDFMNIGSLNGPRHLLDSNIDWGQDLFLLEQWCKKRPDVKEIKTALWTGFPVDLTMIPSTSVPPKNPEPGWFAISVNCLYDDYRRYKKFCPETVIGYTIYIYHITPEDLARAGF